MAKSSVNINSATVITRETEYQLNKDIKFNPQRSPLEYNVYFRVLNNKLTENEYQNVIINEDVPLNYFYSTTGNCLSMQPTSITLNTSETANYTYNFTVQSYLKLNSVFSVEGGNTLGYLPYISGSSRAGVNSNLLTFIDETDDFYIYDLRTIIRVESGYKYVSRYSPPKIKFIFFSNYIGLVSQNTISVNLVQE